MVLSLLIVDSENVHWIPLVVYVRTLCMDKEVFFKCRICISKDKAGVILYFVMKSHENAKTNTVLARHMYMLYIYIYSAVTRLNI